MMYSDVVKDFAHRTRANLEAIDALKENGEEVYEATQLVNSLLGLLVFPRQTYINIIPTISVDDLREQGWPVPEDETQLDKVTNLRKFIDYFRHAIAHFNIEFIGDESNEIVKLRVWNKPYRSQDKDWEVELSLEDLRVITDKFIGLIESDIISA